MDTNVDQCLSLEEFVTTLMATAPRMDRQMRQNCMKLAATFLVPDVDNTHSSGMDKLGTAASESNAMTTATACHEQVLKQICASATTSSVTRDPDSRRIHSL
eukprot:gnl/MRDRNA2_/MRDRNA2_513054_c0_seq1.p1 gnl/MRDRNA2_/MRDRNA2_513054_c0~~gnl/MRDRNA2_/MRDRNA2_513054_c0_seq1.p1  ORF type:complete len:118 (+),score=19.97 gnl/MRDRNA2_/MRDRNA2_513054_c0_seq1:50-355(+)